MVQVFGDEATMVGREVLTGSAQRIGFNFFSVCVSVVLLEACPESAQRNN